MSSKGRLVNACSARSLGILDCSAQYIKMLIQVELCVQGLTVAAVAPVIACAPAAVQCHDCWMSLAMNCKTSVMELAGGGADTSWGNRAERVGAYVCDSDLQT